MGGPQDGSGSLPRRQRLLLGLLGFTLAGAVSAAVALSGGSASVGAAPSPSATSTQPAVRVLSVSRTEQDGFVTMVVLNEGSAVRLHGVRVEGAGYATGDGGGVPGLAVRGSGSLFVSVRPDCSAGLGVPRRPELVLDVSTASGESATLRLPLIGSAALPAELAGRCEAPLGDGARIAVRQVPADGAGGDVRLQLTLTAGRGMLWLDEIRGDVSSLDPGGGGSVLVQPEETEVVDLVVRIGSCDAPPAPAALQLRREPGLEPRVLLLADVGGPAYRDAVATAFRRVCG